MIIIGILLIIFVGVIVIRTWNFKPKTSKVEKEEGIKIDVQGMTKRLSRMIQCKTISKMDESAVDWEAFHEFKRILPELYPLVHQACDGEAIGPTGLLYKWKGRSSKAPIVLMSHYDVVPANEELWSKPAFEGIVEEDVIWGRGTLDTKGTLCGILEAAEHLISQNFVPENDVYFSFSGDEETSGPSTPAIVEVLHERGVRPNLVLDEGGAIIENIFPGVAKACAVVGTGEKGYLDILLEAKGEGGHSSAPPAHTLVGKLAKAVVKIENKAFKPHFTPPVDALFDTLGRHSSIGMRTVFANLWCFKPLITLYFKMKGGELNALIRTTTAVTKMEGSKAFNVMPPKASVGINLRLLYSDSVDSAVAYIKKVIQDDSIEVKIIESRNASPNTPTDTRQWRQLEQTIKKNWGNVIVSPYLMLGATDSRHFCRICHHVFRFSAMPLTKEERGLIHGNDERIPVKTMIQTIEFYIRFLQS